MSEEIFPGFTFSRLSYVLSLFRPAIINEIFPKDWREELILLDRDPSSFTPTLDGRYLLLGNDPELNKT